MLQWKWIVLRRLWRRPLHLSGAENIAATVMICHIFSLGRSGNGILAGTDSADAQSTRARMSSDAHSEGKINQFHIGEILF